MIAALAATMLAPAAAHRLLSPADTTVLLLAAGSLLVIVECLRPGGVIPGASGLLLILLGLHALAALPVRALGVSLLAAGIALLPATLFPSRRWAAGLCGCAALASGFPLLISPIAGTRPITPVLGVTAGVVLGLGTASLLRVAARARANKRHRTAPEDAVSQWQPHGAE